MFGRKKTDKLIQAEIEVLRRSLEHSLYTQSALERSRADIMRLFEKTRTITDTLYGSLTQFEIETLSKQAATVAGKGKLYTGYDLEGNPTKDPDKVVAPDGTGKFLITEATVNALNAMSGSEDATVIQ